MASSVPALSSYASKRLGADTHLKKRGQTATAAKALALMFGHAFDHKLTAQDCAGRVEDVVAGRDRVTLPQLFEDPELPERHLQGRKAGREAGKRVCRVQRSTARAAPGGREMGRERDGFGEEGRDPHGPRPPNLERQYRTAAGPRRRSGQG